MQTLKHSIEKYRATYADWLATTKDGDLETDNAEFEAFATAELDLVRFQCRSSQDVQEKVKFFGETRELRETIANDVNESGEPYLSLFISSLSIPSLSSLIEQYRKAQRIWEAQFDEDEKVASESPEWHAYMDASCAIIDYRCSDMAETERRATFMLSDGNLVDLLANCSSEAAVRDFLTSMAGPVDKSKNGEN